MRIISIIPRAAGRIKRTTEDESFVATPRTDPRPLFTGETFEWPSSLSPSIQHSAKNEKKFLPEVPRAMKKSKNVQRRHPPRSFAHPSLFALYHRSTAPVSGIPPKNRIKIFTKIPLKQKPPFRIFDPRQSKLLSLFFRKEWW